MEATELYLLCIIVNLSVHNDLIIITIEPKSICSPIR